MAIYNQALLVTLSISLPPIQRTAREASIEVSDQYRADRSQARVVKSLFTKRDLQPLQKVAGQARNYLKNNALPYGSHLYLVPTNKYFEFIEGLNKIAARFDEEKTKFISRYQNAKTAAWERLGDLYDEDDYPSIESLSQSIALRVEVQPISPYNQIDTLFDLEDVDVETIKQHAIQTERHRTQKAINTLVHNLLSTLKKAATRLSVQDAQFKKSLIENIGKSAQAIRDFNVFDDENLTKMADDVEKLSLGLNTEEIRADAGVRTRAATEIKNTLDRLSSYSF